MRDAEPEARLITAELVQAAAERIFADFLHGREKTRDGLPPAEPEVTGPKEPEKSEEKTLAEQRSEQPDTLPAPQMQVAVLEEAEKPGITALTEQKSEQAEAPPPPQGQIAVPKEAEKPEVTTLTEQKSEEAEAPPAPQAQIAVLKEPEKPEVKAVPEQKSERPEKATLAARTGKPAGSRPNYVALGLVTLLMFTLAVMAVTHFEELQREQTERELEEFVSHLSAARNTFKLAHKSLALDESNLALKESNLLALAQQARQQEQETLEAKEESSRLAGQQTNYQSRIAQLNDEKARAEYRLAQWSSLLNDLTNQLAAVTTQKEELEARNRALMATNLAGIRNPGIVRPAPSNVTDEKLEAAMESIPRNISAITPDAEPPSQRNVNVLLTHGECLISDDGTNFQPMQIHQVLHQGAVIRTGKRSWCDLFVRRAGITVRMAPESQMKIAKLSLAHENGVAVIDTSLELSSGRIFTVVRALIPSSTVEISDATGRSVIEGGGLGSYMITAPRPDSTDKLSVLPLRVVSQKGTSVIAPGQEYTAKEGETFTLGASTWEAMLIQLDELEAEADKSLAEPEPRESTKNQ